MRFLTSRNPWFMSGRARRSLLTLLAATVLLGSGSSAKPMRDGSRSESVRVRLFEIYKPRSVSLNVARGELLAYADDSPLPLFRLESGSGSTVSLSRGLVRVVSPDGETLHVAAIQFVPSDSAAIFDLSVVAGARQSDTRRFTGEISFSPDPDDGNELLPVNSVDLELYVAAVVTSEYGLEDLEGNKAMAVLARTYALRSKGKFGDAYDHVDHSISQVFHGIGDIKPAALAAARATAGQVLTYDGSLAEAVYHAESGGHTANNESVWTGGKPIPYLRGREDPYANKSPYASWTFRASRSRLLAALRKTYGGTVTGIRIADVGPNGRVRTVQVLRRQGNVDVSANDFRLLFLRTFGQYSLKSTIFTARREGGTYVFEGRGFGHGVGMSQWGAHEMAAEGFSYRDILAFYFVGTELSDSSVGTQLASDADAVVGVSAPDSLPKPILRLPEEVVDRSRRRRGRIGW